MSVYDEPLFDYSELRLIKDGLTELEITFEGGLLRAETDFDKKKAALKYAKIVQLLERVEEMIPEARQEFEPPSDESVLARVQRFGADVSTSSD